MLDRRRHILSLANHTVDRCRGGLDISLVDDAIAARALGGIISGCIQEVREYMDTRLATETVGADVA